MRTPMIFDLDHWQEIWASLARNRTRTVLTAFGVFWGIFMLMLLLGSGQGLANGVNSGFSRFATNSFFLWSRRTGQPYRGLPAGREIRLDNRDTEAIHEQIPEAAVVAPRLQLGGHGGGTTVVYGGNTGAFTVTGDIPAIRNIESLDMLKGRFIDRIDFNERRKVAVIGTQVENTLFTHGEDPIGLAVQINGIYFRVVGVFSPPGSGERAQRASETIYIPLSTFQQAFNRGDEVGWYAITAKPGIPASSVEEKVVKLLKERHRVAPDDGRAIGHWNLEKEFNKIQSLFLGIRLLIWIVGIGTLSAGVIGVSNIMLILVRERTKEIGLRRAIGASPWSITLQVMLESVVMTAIAGYFGLLAGVGVLELVRTLLVKAGSRAFQDPGVSFDNALLALAILVLAGVLAGLLPAQRAIAISPREALRSE